MKGTISFAAIVAFAALLVVPLLVSAQEGGPTLAVTVEAYSGRPNPTFHIADPEAIDRLRKRIGKLPAASITRSESIRFSRLGYRGIVIVNQEGIEGIPEYIQALDGKVKIIWRGGDEALFFEDAQGLERYCLGMAKSRGLIADLLEAGHLPDPDSM